MKDQHEYIEGYRDLDAQEIHRINQFKEIGNQFGTLFAFLEAEGVVDQRWLAIAKTDFQKGMMALVRSVAKPEGF